MIPALREQACEEQSPPCKRGRSVAPLGHVWDEHVIGRMTGMTGRLNNYPVVFHPSIRPIIHPI